MLYLYGYRFYRPLDHFCRRSSLRFQRCLQVLDHGLKLLVRQALDHIALLDLVLARAQQRQNLQVRGRLCSAHTFNRLRAAVPEVSEQGCNKLAVQLLTVTRADRTAGRVLTGSFMDYAMPRADDFCAVVIEDNLVPTATNPLMMHQNTCLQPDDKSARSRGITLSD